jgi:hypothetical protein
MNTRHLLLWPTVVVATLLGPAALHAQNPVQLVCKDGSSAPGPDPSACAGHGGVDQAATDAAVKARAGAGMDSTQMVVCKDGSTAKPGPTACRSQGGVDSAATRAAVRERSRGRAAEPDSMMGRDTTGKMPPHQAQDSTKYRSDST